MKNQSLSPAAQFSVAAIVLLGMVGGSLIVAHGGFETSPKRGGQSVFVPAPQGYFIAATMFGMSILGMFVLIREWRWPRIAMVLAFVLYVTVAAALILGIGSM
jgi:TRAP-type C4-dicarboxylate transport system permease small subunit